MTGTAGAARGLHQPHGFVEIGLGAQRVGDRVDVGADVDRDDVGALFGQRDGMAAPLAARGAGDDGDGVVEFTHDRKRTYSIQKDRVPGQFCHDSGVIRHERRQ